ncbi:response regulator transcription factor [Sphingomonas sp. PB4P5]|uniref:response regulator transcription factor n=1 Tax=Parasphingomonas puruogangriensis TaxID=3096155 RepID=UPI002FC63E5F
MSRPIYLVDDDAAVRASLAALLSLQPGFAVRSFGSGDAFLAAAPALDPGVVLLDLHMPGANGIDVLCRIRAVDPGRFAAIIITGDGSITLAVQAMKAGAIDFIEKPYGAALLLTTVDDAFARLLEEDAAAARARAAQDRIAALSPRERDVLAGLIEGRGNKVIAHQLDISPRTVEIYRANLMTRLGVRSLPEALRVAFAAGMIPAA